MQTTYEFRDMPGEPTYPMRADSLSHAYGTYMACYAAKDRIPPDAAIYLHGEFIGGIYRGDLVRFVFGEDGQRPVPF